MLQKEPLISIIIPTYNRAHLIGETLDSILAQTYENWECIVVDDGSTDHTAEVMEKYISKDARFQYHHRPKDRPAGGNAARNYGFEMSKGEFIQWFDSDDLMEKNLLEKQLNNLYHHQKNISICLHDRYNEDFSILTHYAKPNRIKYSVYYDYILRDLKVNLPTTFFKRNMVEKFMLSESLFKSQEYEFLQNVFKHHHQDCVLLNFSLVKVRRHAGSITKRTEVKFLISAIEVRLMVFRNLPKDAPIIVKKSILENYLVLLKKFFIMKEDKEFFHYLNELKNFNYRYISLTTIYLKFLYRLYHTTGKGLMKYDLVFKTIKK